MKCSSKISRLSFLALMSMLHLACTSSKESTSYVDPFADVEWPDSLVPSDVEGDTILSFNDGSNFPAYSPFYFDTAPTHAELNFTGASTGGQVEVTGLPLFISLTDVGRVVIQYNHPARSAISTWSRPPSESNILGPFSVEFAAPPVDVVGVDAAGEPIVQARDRVDRNYRFADLILQFNSVEEEGGRLLYRGVYLSGSFSFTVGASYGDQRLDTDGANTRIEYSLIGYPFIFSTPIPVEPELEPEPAPDPAPAPDPVP